MFILDIAPGQLEQGVTVRVGGRLLFSLQAGSAEKEQVPHGEPQAETQEGPTGINTFRPPGPERRPQSPPATPTEETLDEGQLVAIYRSARPTLRKVFDILAASADGVPLEAIREEFRRDIRGLSNRGIGGVVAAAITAGRKRGMRSGLVSKVFTGATQVYRMREEFRRVVLRELGHPAACPQPAPLQAPQGEAEGARSIAQVKQLFPGDSPYCKQLFPGDFPY